jgi:hypothetical protein
MATGFKKFNGGDTVGYGFYWNVGAWEAQIVPKEGGELKGTPADNFVRLPLLALLVLAPLMGAAFAFFLPFIGFAMLLMFLAGKLRSMFTTTPPAVDASAKAEAARAAHEKTAQEAGRKRAA